MDSRKLIAKMQKLLEKEGKDAYEIDQKRDF